MNLLQAYLSESKNGGKPVVKLVCSDPRKKKACGAVMKPSDEEKKVLGPAMKECKTELELENKFKAVKSKCLY